MRLKTLVSIFLVLCFVALPMQIIKAEKKKSPWIEFLKRHGLAYAGGALLVKAFIIDRIQFKQAHNVEKVVSKYFCNRQKMPAKIAKKTLKGLRRAGRARILTSGAKSFLPMFAEDIAKSKTGKVAVKAWPRGGLTINGLPRFLKWGISGAALVLIDIIIPSGSLAATDMIQPELSTAEFNPFECNVDSMQRYLYGYLLTEKSKRLHEIYEDPYFNIEGIYYALGAEEFDYALLMANLNHFVVKDYINYILEGEHGEDRTQEARALLEEFEENSEIVSDYISLAEGVCEEGEEMITKLADAGG